MSKTYNITRQHAADTLGVSTRTIDRYIKNGRLSYKKIANKVILAKEEIASLQNDFSSLRQETESEVMSQNHTTAIARPNNNNGANLEAIDEKIDKFFLIFREKDNMLEEKNKIIFMLQQRIGELETKIQHMIALPDYNKERQAALLEKEKLEHKLKEVQG